MGEIEMPSKDEELLSLRMFADRILARLHEELWASSAASKDDDLVASYEMKPDTPSEVVLHDIVSPKSPKGRGISFELREELLAPSEVEVDTPSEGLDHSPKS